MCEILFRGKQKASGVWLHGDLRQWSEKRKGICDYELKQTLDVDPKTVGQFTGLTDKNGKKVFDGDVLMVYGTDTAVVEWDETSAMFMAVFGYADADFASLISQYPDVEVIGNIHDNPELMEVE